MDPEEMQAIITELEHQRSMLGARAAEYARQNFRLLKELKELRDKAPMPRAEPMNNGEDRQGAERFNG